MSSNPFEDPEGVYLALINDEGRYSLRPVWPEIPAGWTVAFGENSKQACLEHIEADWTDMRPNSLIRAMEQ